VSSRDVRIVCAPSHSRRLESSNIFCGPSSEITVVFASNLRRKLVFVSVPSNILWQRNLKLNTEYIKAHLIDTAVSQFHPTFRRTQKDDLRRGQ
jgi:hypothetical protein